MVPQRLSLVTLGVRDVAAARQFYESLGWQVSSASMESIAFFPMAGSALTLFGWGALAEDAGVPPEGQGFRGVALALNLDNEADVDAAFAEWLAAGGSAIKHPVRASWGGYFGYVADLDGHLWELAYNPGFPILADGRLQLPA